ncbi:response regulator transcription factor [Clostridium cellulovorans]|uniref:Stage 0 sporulation protein A homolog n=1 Tax=Clostridium cellulovorans (strain ATCC 35296 / DSM 3052 / OCM 3 / 743B) TaxID=573061 RepID=D9SUL8_CLOC7|nr:response regulator transcription factor [Clostridium cellulovorans]ADL50923.1 two component transcriptional regulator, winged helix family [Clostridium cellulovorans 743B]
MSKVLLVEDDSTLAFGIEYTLKNEGFDVILADNLAKARKAFETEKLDIVLLDVTLPDGNGYEFCREIRSNSTMAIIFLTSCNDEANVVMGLDLGADDYISKPVRIKELISRINAVMRRNGKAVDYANIIKSGNIEINVLKGKVKKAGKEIILTAVEYRLLLTLIEHSEQILSRNTILEKLWDIDGEFIDDNTLSVYIRRLREKIEDDASAPVHILTVRGVGYKWNSKVNY